MVIHLFTVRGLPLTIAYYAITLWLHMQRFKKRSNLSLKKVFPSACQFLNIWCIILFCLLAHLRSIHLAYVEDVEVKGIQAYRFAPPNDVLMSPKNNPANEGFCVPAGDCLGTGVLKVSVCREGELVPKFPPALFLCPHPSR